MNFPLSEYFVSFQGEGPYTGRYCLFLRSSDCNLLCPFCDSRDRLGKVAHNLSEDDILNLVNKDNHRHIVITGGEPMLYAKEWSSLVQRLPDSVEIIEFETNGTLPIPAVLASHAKVHFNISPKVWAGYNALQILQNSVYKFPVNASNFADTIEFIREWNIPDRQIWLMPLAETADEYFAAKEFVADRALAHGWNFSSRLQILHKFA